MSKRGYIARYILLIKRLESRPFSSFEEIKSHLFRQMEQWYLQDDDLVMGFSKRTLQRDIREIRTLFGIHIVFDQREEAISYVIRFTRLRASSG